MVQRVYVFLGSFIISIFLLQWWQKDIPLLLIALIWLMLLLLYFLKQYECILYCCVVISAILLACSSAQYTLHRSSINTIDTFATKRFIHIRGVIVAEPDRRPMQTKYTIASTEIITASGTQITKITGKILFTDRRQWPEFYYGDTVEISGILEVPEIIDDTFYYDRYLSRYDIYSVMYSGSIKKISTLPLSISTKIWRNLFGVKEKFETQINRLYPEPHASFMAGLLTGSRKGIPIKVLESFNITGLTHIIAISGYNITIIITIITGILHWLPKRYQLVPACIGIIVFTIIVGASAAVVRAAIMGILGLIALYVKQPNTARITVLWTIVFMTFYNPKYLWYDAGFQLSFLAVIGLLEVSPLLEKFTAWIPNTLGLRESIQMTMAAQIMAAPLIVILFGRFSLIAPVANLLVAPLIPPAMLFGFIGTIFSICNFTVGQFISYFAWGLLETIIRTSKTLALTPFASIETYKISWFIGTLYYIGLLCIILWYHQKNAT